MSSHFEKMESNVSSEGYRFQFFLVLGPDPWPPLQFMTTANAIRIGNLFHEVLQCEQSSRTNMVGMKYMRIRVELDVRKPIVTGFIQKVGNGTEWIQFVYEKLAEFCYNCGVIGHY